jgi:hypothetical protein
MDEIVEEVKKIIEESEPGTSVEEAVPCKKDEDEPKPTSN